MTGHVARATTTATARVTERPPILEAIRSLGLNDRMIAELMGVTSVAVNQWALGKRPIPLVRHLALLFLVGRLTGRIGAAVPPQSRYARRAAVAREAALAWAELAKHELGEEVGGELGPELLERTYPGMLKRSFELGGQMLAKLEAQ
jgi:hypothetical protein